jgi:hypothetical protein
MVILCVKFYFPDQGLILVSFDDLIYFLFLVFNATFSNISAMSWRPVLVVEEAGDIAEILLKVALNTKNKK